MPAVISREYRIYLALWRKAYISKQEVTVTAPTFSMAVAMRQGMYRAIRPFRSGQMQDTDLRNAAENYVVFLEKGPPIDKPHRLIFRERKTLAALNEVFDTLGIDEDDLLLAEERAIGDSLKRLVDDQPSEPERITHFYSRD